MRKLESLKQTHTELQAERDGHVASLREAEAAREQAQEEASVLKRDLESLQSEHATLQESSAKLQQLKETAESAAQAATLRLERLESELSALQECTVGLTGESGTDSREMVARLLSRVGALEAAVAESESKRRALHNALVELKGNIRVFCRVRPSTGGAGSGSVACAADGAGVRVADDAGREHEFRFDRVFRPDASQAAVYAEVSDLVQSALDGYKVCLFSYGQTGAGKTHTMQGTSQLGEGAGIIPRAARQILAAAAALRERGYEYSLEATFVEVYNETLRDLLAGKGARLPDGNAIQHPADGGHTVVLGATRMPVADEADVADVLARAAAARSVEATAMNATSSRSHSVFTLNITGVHAASDAVLRGSLSLVDLAGSERLARSGAEGARAKEACSINRSLSALGDVFQALAARAAHVPYRNSKLTHLLQPCLGGSGKTLMFVNVNPDPASAGETLCSLRFAAKVNAVDTAAKGGAARHVSSLAETGARAVAEAKRKAAGAGVSAGAAGRAVRSRGAL
ncbi:hypothetical protein QBZ16_005049 [Prototheca wickerhamii]|uniref:Kinesin-like protein n=1 Tax=Prototheca wickerhamii TaxID=3111 RepID=A0AAD9IER2_PROWI|nr:hypothetical protein QBZ16_005049 [Prototheca wickerhamii]